MKNSVVTTARGVPVFFGTSLTLGCEGWAMPGFMVSSLGL
jgi:hypothetical protein